MDPTAQSAPAQTALGGDFWKFFAGQTISNLGSSVTLFALPLLVYELTGSALNLGIVTAAEFVPYLLFGLIIGAWVDRLDRKRLMIVTDLLRCAAIGSIPLLFWLDLLTVEVVYAVAFVTSTLTIAFSSAEFAAIPSLVRSDDLVAANGRIQASYAAAQVAGPLLAGILRGVMPLEDILLVDAASFLVSAGTVALIRRPFSQISQHPAGRSIRRDVVEGLRYVLGHPVLRSISLMMALVNFVATTFGAQLVFFAKDSFDASDAQTSLLFSAGSIGVILLGLAAGPLRQRYRFATVALGSLVASGVLTVIFAFNTWFWLALPLQALIAGLGILFNINTGSLRQEIVPNHLLGRVISIAGVLAWSANPLGALLGGWAIDQTDNVRLVYTVVGVTISAIALGFWLLSPLGHAERYLTPATEPESADFGPDSSESRSASAA